VDADPRVQALANCIPSIHPQVSTTDLIQALITWLSVDSNVQHILPYVPKHTPTNATTITPSNKNGAQQ
jgi:hypothetical protein